MANTMQLATSTDYRKEFADFGDVIYMNVSYQAPLPLTAVRAAQEALEWKMLPFRIEYALHYELPDRVRAKIARIIGAQPDDVAITTGASAGAACVAAGIDWQPGDEVLVGQREFPIHYASWVPYQRAGKLTMRTIAPAGRFITADDYIRAIGPRTRIVSASLVRFDDGARLDAARVAKACHDAGAMLLLDASQCAGAMPMSVAELGADFIVCSGYKWLLGPYGAGFFWVAREAGERLITGPLNYQALEGARNVTGLPVENLRAVPGARRWDAAETANFTNLAALDASLDLVLAVGVDEVARHNHALVTQIIERLPGSHCALASPAERERRGPYLCIAARDAGQTAALFEKLRQNRVFVSLREGSIRIAPYLYNTPEQIARVMDLLSA
ncbi:MAG TPA: aminotransferase class V-fold PLP-dependent enzyme [Candidatus Acidoferrales bacterium]|jgi:selenocysteine lyase/cysteine desulfurase|nr:aminotransferase class V-fold PLP-dependent enzyme [Candidatus Acidoferrales bacterium]